MLTPGKLVFLKQDQRICLGYSEYLDGFNRNSDSFKTNPKPGSLFLVVKNISPEDDKRFCASFNKTNWRKVHILWDVRQKEICWVWDDEADRFEAA